MRRHRILSTLLLIAPLLANPGFSQSNSPLTPQQQQDRVVEARRQQLRSQAKQAFDAQMAREQADQCPGAQNTQEFNDCFGKAAAIAADNLKSYTDALRAILVLRYSDSPSKPVTGIAGVEQTPEQDGAEFTRLEQLWQRYKTAASAAAFHQLDGGTAGPSFELETEIRLTRNHMRELNSIYNEILNL